MAIIDPIIPLGSNVSKLDLRNYLAGRELATPFDFGGVMDGVVDDSAAINQALSEKGSCFLKTGTWRINSPICVPSNAILLGAGNSTLITCDDNSFDAVQIQGRRSIVSNFKVYKGNSAIRFWPKVDSNYYNYVQNVWSEEANYGMTLDGFSENGYRCYWNRINQVTILAPKVVGVLLDKTEGGDDDDTPNANTFREVIVFVDGRPFEGGTGIWVKRGNYMNTFTDCEVDLGLGNAYACVRVSAGCQTNCFTNIYTETQQEVTNVLLEEGATDTRIVNLFAASAGPAILDNSGGDYDAFGAGFPDRHHFRRGRFLDLTVDRLRYEIRFVEPESATTIVVPDTERKTFYLVSAFAGAVTLELPNPANVEGTFLAIKKNDSSANVVTVTSTFAGGPDGNDVQLTAQNDHVQLVSRGGSWCVIAKGYPDPIGPYTLSGSSFTRSLNSDSASFEDLRGFVMALALDLKTRRIIY